LKKKTKEKEKKVSFTGNENRGGDERLRRNEGRY